MCTVEIGPQALLIWQERCDLNGERAKEVRPTTVATWRVQPHFGMFDIATPRTTGRRLTVHSRPAAKLSYCTLQPVISVVNTAESCVGQQTAHVYCVLF